MSCSGDLQGGGGTGPRPLPGQTACITIQPCSCPSMLVACGLVCVSQHTVFYAAHVCTACFVQAWLLTRLNGCCCQHSQQWNCAVGCCVDVDHRAGAAVLCTKSSRPTISLLVCVHAICISRVCPCGVCTHWLSTVAAVKTLARVVRACPTLPGVVVDMSCHRQTLRTQEEHVAKWTPVLQVSMVQHDCGCC